MPKNGNKEKTVKHKVNGDELLEILNGLVFDYTLLSQSLDWDPDDSNVNIKDRIKVSRFLCKRLGKTIINLIELFSEGEEQDESQ